MNLRHSLLVAVLAAGLGGPLPALSEKPHAAPAGVDQVDVEVDVGVADRLPLSAEPLPTARLRAPALHGPGPVRLRWGADLHSSSGAGVRPFVGVGLAAGTRTTLFYEHAGTEPPPQSPLTSGDDARMGFEFRMRSHREAWRDVGTLRMQLGMNSRLSVKPRRGGVKLTLQAHF